jgi:hypothetical protein
LYAETKGDKPGFSETRIRELCIEIGGAAVGAIFDDCVMKPVELPIDTVLPKMGMANDAGIVKDLASGPTEVGANWPR